MKGLEFLEQAFGVGVGGAAHFTVKFVKTGWILIQWGPCIPAIGCSCLLGILSMNKHVYPH